MATQNLEFGYATGQTLTAEVFPVGSDASVQTASAVNEAVNRGGRYIATFTDVPAGDYLLIYSSAGIEVGFENYSLSNNDATFFPWTETPPSQIGSSDSPPTVYRSVEDTQAISFSFPVSSASLTGAVSVDLGPEMPVNGTISYSGVEHGRYIYRLSYDAADRPNDVEGVAVYNFTDNTYSTTVYLRTEPQDINMDQATPGGSTTGEQLDKAGTGTGGGNGGTTPEPTYMISVRFIDSLGNGVYGTRVSVQGNDTTDVSNNNGNATLGVEVDGTYVIDVVPPAGYVYTATLIADVQGTDVDLGNQLLESAPVGTLPPVGGGWIG